jgi:hypothetical protein
MVVDVLLHPRFAEAILFAGRTEGFFRVGHGVPQHTLCRCGQTTRNVPEMLRMQHDLSIDVRWQGA